MQDHKLQVLLIEDNPTDALLMRHALADIPGTPAVLQEARSLREGMAAAAANRHDILLLDLVLPDSSGTDSIRRIRSAHEAIPLIVLTGKQHEETAEESLRLGADDFMIKERLSGPELGRAIRYAIERRRAAAALRGKEDQLLQFQKMEAVGRLAGGVAHDFNNILMVIMGYAQLLQMQIPEGDPNREAVDEILKAGERATKLTAQLLTFGRRQSSEPRILSLNDLIANVEKMLKRMIGEDVKMEGDLAPNLWSVRIDPIQAEQVLMNLAINARDAMPKGGKLTIRSRNDRVAVDDTLPPGEYVALEVEDTGSGIPPEVLPHIFEPFFTTKEKGKGTGLGLATVYGIVQQHAGSISAESRPGRTLFRIRLPRAMEERSSPDPARTAESPAKGSETILLVEDEDGVRTFVSRVLQGAGYRVLEARSGEEALRISEQEPGRIDLAIADVVLEGMPGPDLMRAMGVRRPSLRVIYFSGYTASGVVRRGVTQKDLILQKPVRSDELTRKVREVLDARS